MIDMMPDPVSMTSPDFELMVKMNASMIATKIQFRISNVREWAFLLRESDGAGQAISVCFGGLMMV
jgi:hypothetical protein